MGLLDQEFARQRALREQGIDPGAPDWARATPDPSAPPDSALQAPETADSLWDAFSSGFQTSTTGLALRRKGPDVFLEENATRAQQLSHTVGMILGDTPTYVAGAVAGAATAPGTTIAAPVIAGGTAMALTEGTRQWLLDSYAEGATKDDLADRLTAASWAAAKGFTIGGATMGVGAKARQLLAKPAAPSAVEGTLAQSAQRGEAQALGLSGEVKVASAELATMVGVSSALEGHIPSPDDFLNAAIVLGGLKGSTMVAGKLKDIYVRTGKTPEQVMKEAADKPGLTQELIDSNYPSVPLTMRGSIRSEAGPRAPEHLAQSPIALAVNQAIGPKHKPQPIKFNASGKAEGPWDFNTSQWAGPESIKATAKQIAREEKLRMESAQGGRRSMQDMADGAAAWLREIYGKDMVDQKLFRADPAQWAEEMIGRYQTLRGALGEFQHKAATVAEKKSRGEAVTEVELVDMLSSRDAAVMAAETFRGRQAEWGRAGAAQRHASKLAGKTEELDKIVKDVLNDFRGKEGAEVYARMVAEIKDPAGLAELAKTYSPMEKLGYVVNSFLVSGFRTHEVNLLSTMAFTGLRLPESQITAAIGQLTRSADRATFTESLGLMQGVGIGYNKAIRAAHQTVKMSEGEYNALQKMWKEFMNVKRSDKTEELEGKPLKGTFGSGRLDDVINDILATPYKALSMTDHFTGLGNYWGSMYQQAWREVVKRQGAKAIGTRDFHRRVRELAESQPKEMAERAWADRQKYNFLEEGGRIVKTMQGLRKDLPILRVTPLNFIQTPGAIIREFTRRTPFAPAIKQWRDDYKAGGLKRDRALAELATGTGIGLTAFWLASEGIVTGSGHPDKEVRDAWLADGWQPGSIWVPGKGYVSISRYEPLATLFTLAANVQQAHELMTEEERDKAWTALMFAATDVAHNKTWMKGLSGLVNAIANPDRYGEGWLENLSTMAVPQLLGQAAQTMDPYVREIDGVLDAVKSRIPGIRGSLAKRYDPFGEPIEAAAGLWPGSPSTVRKPTGDPVRAEAARLGISQSDAPRKLSAGTMFGESAMVELTPEQREKYIQTAGQMAYRIMQKRVTSPAWNNMTGAMQRMLFEEAFRDGRDMARERVLQPTQRREALKQLREDLDL